MVEPTHAKDKNFNPGEWHNSPLIMVDKEPTTVQLVTLVGKLIDRPRSQAEEILYEVCIRKLTELFQNKYNYVPDPTATVPGVQ